MIHYPACPVCKSDAVKPAFSAKDYTVSNEIFRIWKCNGCSAMFTQDVPGQDEIGKYYQSENYISHSDTEEGFINKLYHRVRKRTILQKMQLVKRETGLRAGNILDIGCGTGAFLKTMQDAGWVVTGLEPDETARRKAQSLYNIYPRPSQQIFRLPQNSFDAVTAWHVIEHVHQLHEYIDQLKKLIKQNGRIFIAVPNYSSYDAEVYREFWAAYDVPRHLYHFTPKSISALMQMHGLKVQQIMPMWFDSFYVSMLSEKYKKSNGNILKAAWTGLLSNAKAFLDKSKCSSVIYVVGQ